MPFSPLSGKTVSGLFALSLLAFVSAPAQAQQCSCPGEPAMAAEPLPPPPSDFSYNNPAPMDMPAPAMAAAPAPQMAYNNSAPQVVGCPPGSVAKDVENSLTGHHAYDNPLRTQNDYRPTPYGAPMGMRPRWTAYESLVGNHTFDSPLRSMAYGPSTGGKHSIAMVQGYGMCPYNY